MIRSLLLMAYFCLFSYSSPAQLTILGADAFGRANSLVAVPGYSSIYQNPGGMGVDSAFFLSFHLLRVVPVEGFHTAGVQGIFRGRGFNYGFSVDSFGDRNYRESRAGLAVARGQDRVWLGVKMSYMNTYWGGAGARGAFVGEMGMVVKPAPLFSLGLCVVGFSPVKPSPGLPVTLAMGAGIYPNSKVSLSSQLDYPPGGRAVMRWGLNYQVRKQLGFSAGINPELRSVHFGMNVWARSYGYFYGIASHPYVGIAHHSTFIYTRHE